MNIGKADTGYFNAVGGILGYAIGGNVKLIKCINYANIYGYQNVGGISGGKGLENIEIDQCCNFGNIEASYVQVGGIIGGTFGGQSTIINCYNIGKITGTSKDSLRKNWRNYRNCVFLEFNRND